MVTVPRRSTPTFPEMAYMENSAQEFHAWNDFHEINKAEDYINWSQVKLLHNKFT